MVRVFIRNGTCGAEDFFKCLGTESRTYVLQDCFERNSAMFCELRDELQDIMDESTLSRRLAELVSMGLLDKIRYANASSARAVYRMTQKAVDLNPIFEAMRDFHRKWGPEEDSCIINWIACTKKLLGSRWNARIIWLLFVLRAVRFNELKNSIEGVSFKMLTQQLRYLEGEDVVLRKDFHENPPHIEYSLTQKGDALYEIMLLIAKWNSQYGLTNGSMGTQNSVV